jgi:hypothetical protein
VSLPIDTNACAWHTVQHTFLHAKPVNMIQFPIARFEIQPISRILNPRTPSKSDRLRVKRLSLCSTAVAAIKASGRRIPDPRPRSPSALGDLSTDVYLTKRSQEKAHNLGSGVPCKQLRPSHDRIVNAGSRRARALSLP